MADEIFTQRLLNWAVKEKGLEALKLVIPIVEDKYRITSYGFKRTPGTGGKLKPYIYNYIPLTYDPVFLRFLHFAGYAQLAEDSLINL